MSFSMEKKEKISEAINRISQEQLLEIIEITENDGISVDEKVHETRKILKKMRAVMRLARIKAGEKFYKKENKFYRDLGRKISELRDAKVKMETLDNLLENAEKKISRSTYNNVSRYLQNNYEAVKQTVIDNKNTLAKINDDIYNKADEAKYPYPPLTRFKQALPGIKKVYKRGRKSYGKALENMNPEILHEWRKRVKYLWYQVRIMETIYPQLLEGYADSLHDLSDYLGDFHDLDELEKELKKIEMNKTMQRDFLHIWDEFASSKLNLYNLALSEGKKIYVDKPKTFINRLSEYRKAQKMAVPEL